MEFTLREIADKIGAEVIGDGEMTVCDVSSFEDAGPHEITFASEPAYLKQLDRCRAGAVIIPDTCKDVHPDATGSSFLLSDRPRLQFFRILSWFYPKKKPEESLSAIAHIGQTVKIGADVTVSPGVSIGNDVTLGDRVCLMPGVFVGNRVTIGSDVTLFPNVTVMDYTIIGSRVVIQAGSVIGSDGFGFTPGDSGHEKIPHSGYVQIDDDVEIGACNTIDRGTFGRTWIKQGVKTDNLIQIAHNVTIGKNCLIAAQAGIAGSTILGDNVILAGQAGVSGHLTIGSNVIVGPKGGVSGNVPDGRIVSGMPEMPHKIWLKVSRILPRLPDFRRKLSLLEKKIKDLDRDGG